MMVVEPCCALLVILVGGILLVLGHKSVHGRKHAIACDLTDLVAIAPVCEAPVPDTLLVVRR